MAQRFTLLDLPGKGKNLRIEHDSSALIKELHKELSKLIADPLQGKHPPKNALSTIKRKGSSVPLRDTGKLLDDILVEISETSLKVSIQGYYFYLKKPYRLLFRTKDIMDAVSRVAQRFADRFVRLV